MLRTFSLVRRFSSAFPIFQPISTATEKYHEIRVITSSEIDKEIPQSWKEEFEKSKSISIPNSENLQFSKRIFNEKSAKKIAHISKNTYISFSSQFLKHPSFFGVASNIFAEGHKFSRKQIEEKGATLYHDSFDQLDYILELAQSKIRSREMANIRGDQATTEYFDKQTKRIADQFNLKRTVIRGDDLLKEGFRLMHAVGRASEHQPIFVNLKYEGNPESKEWYCLVGKGVCFDSGGLNLKPTSSIGGMHMDKHGSTSVLSAMEAVAKLKLKINLTVSLGYVENAISNNAYRPLDIIKSRKGLTVEIGNTDAEGRLVLADCMHWTQENYNVKEMVELSTLTGAIIVALGRKHAGMFGNNQQLMKKLMEAGARTGEEVWEMPVDEYHHQIIKAKQADISNAPGKPEASSSQAAAFLERFVEKDVKWIHLDIAGVSMVENQATGYGARLLLDYLKNSC